MRLLPALALKFEIVTVDVPEPDVVVKLFIVTPPVALAEGSSDGKFKGTACKTGTRAISNITEIQKNDLLDCSSIIISVIGIS